MSQARNPFACGDAKNRGRTPVVKTPGDAGQHPPVHYQRSKSKNKIPKSVRYDLENALVGLCNVWFEDIKPHLLRNNIKVHVNNERESAGEDAGAGAGSGAGDSARGRGLGGAPGCSHLDPGAASDRRQRRGASSVACCATPPTASRALCRRRTRLPPHQPSPTARHKATQIHRPLSEGKPSASKQSVGQQSHLSQLNSPDLKWKVPRLCRTLSLPPLPIPAGRLRASTNPPLPQLDTHQLLRPNKMIEKKRKRKHNSQAIQTEGQPLRGPKDRAWQRVGPQKAISLGRSRPSTALYHHRHNPSEQLFRNDLIDLIGDYHDIRLKELFISPRRQEYPSTLNHVRTCKDHRNNKSNTVQPWK